ncbi:MAG TPA: hypothetical protein VE244_10850 [Nitrososphaeraceae archaeon]|nr:hypothetical protein [Nitrososphaeraceae archaeon]
MIYRVAKNSLISIYSGVVTFTASQPVEAVVLHGYTPSQAPDQAHGEPLNAPFGNERLLSL